jgi:hypothetical protein
MARIKTISAYVAVGMIFLVPTLIFAQRLDNPLSSQFDTIPKFISGALKVMVMVAVPVISLFLVYSGFMFVLAQGNQEKLGKARENFLYVIIGSVLILGAWVIASVLGNTVSELTR